MLPPQHEIERLLAGRNTAETERREATTPADHGAVLRALDTKDRSRKALRGADCRDLKLTMSAFHARVARRGKAPESTQERVQARTDLTGFARSDVRGEGAAIARRLRGDCAPLEPGRRRCTAYPLPALGHAAGAPPDRAVRPHRGMAQCRSASRPLEIQASCTWPRRVRLRSPPAQR